MRSKKRSLRCQGKDSQLTVLPTFLICWMISLLEVSMEGLAAFMVLNQATRGQTRYGEITLNKGYYSFALSTFALVKYGTFARKMAHLPRDF